MTAAETHLDPEELAYNTSTGTPNGSNRRARALCEDGRVRTFRVGIPDTYFTIPAVGKVGGRYVRGFVSYDDDKTLRFTERKS